MGMFDKLKDKAAEKLKEVDVAKEALSATKAVVGGAAKIYLSDELVDKVVYTEDERKEREAKKAEKAAKEGAALDAEFDQMMDEMERSHEQAISDMPEGPEKEKAIRENKARKGICPSCDAQSMVVINEIVIKEWEDETGTMNGKTHDENVANIRYATVTPRKLIALSYKCDSCGFELEAETATSSTSYRGRCLGVNGFL